LQILTDAFGPEKPVSAITRADAGRVYEALRFLPKRFRAVPALAGRSFFEMANEARRLNLGGLHGRTINGYLGTMRSLFDQERKAGQVQENPFEGPHVQVVAGGDSDRGFEAHEIPAIFGNPLFTGAKGQHFAYDPGVVLISDWRFWAPLIALCTGARVAEIAQLGPGDVREVDGVWVITITNNDGKLVKTAASVRHIPVHQRLQDLGLQVLAADRLRGGHARLLPAVPVPVRGDPGKQLSKWMCETLLRRFDFQKRAGLGFHSSRHSMATMLRSADVDGRTADRILGHASEGQGARYGKFEREAMARALNSIKLPEEVFAIPPRFLGVAMPTGHAEASVEAEIGLAVRK
jgi:Phage integrase family